MATFDLGRVTPLYKGDYSASASYELNDVVLYNGNLYWHVQATATVGILPTDTTVWKLAFADEGVRAEIRGYADNAQASADSALASKSAAATSASNASASASQAALSAQTASTKASEASTSAQTASTKASEAAVSAQSAASSAQTATDKATLATNKAQAASESASLATAKASAAATSETNAVTAAQTATTKASEAAASATSAQEYDESAQQSAVNAQTAQGLAETAQTGAETAQGLAEDARDLAQQYAESIDPERIYSAYPTDTAEGSIASFPDGADGIPLKSLVVDINPVQSGSGDPSPDNVRPISGWTGMTVNANGVNLWDKVNGGILNGYIGSTDIVDSTSRKTAYIRCAPNTTYTVSKTRSIAADRFCVAYTKDITAPTVGTAIFGTVNAPNSGTVGTQTSCSITTGTDAKWLVCWFSWDASVQTDDINSLQFELGSSASSYESFNGQTIPINWQTEAGTVYGGHLDVLSGVLTVDRSMVTLDEDDITNVIVEGQICRVLVTSGKISIFDSYRDGVCNKAVVKTSWGGVTGDTSAIAINLPTSNQFVANGAFGTTLQEIKDFVGVDGLQICTYIATPITIQLTPHVVNSLLGQNNIFADTGDTEVEYRADTKMYIERLTEPDADMIADSNIVSGQYFMVGNSLYLATANIASGSVVIEGTNATRKSLSEALNEINQ